MVPVLFLTRTSLSNPMRFCYSLFVIVIFLLAFKKTKKTFYFSFFPKCFNSTLLLFCWTIFHLFGRHLCLNHHWVWRSPSGGMIHAKKWTMNITNVGNRSRSTLIPIGRKVMVKTLKIRDFEFIKILLVSWVFLTLNFIFIIFNQSLIAIYFKI